MALENGPEVVKVLHLINTLCVGGAELHLLTLSRHLKRLGTDVVVACLGERARSSPSLRPEFERDGIEVISLGAESRWDLRFLVRVQALLRHERPDVLHTHLPRADLAGLVSRLGGGSTPWVCSIHADYSSWSGRWTLPLFGRVWRRSDAVIAISQALREWLLRARSLPAKNVRCVYYGIDPDSYATPGTNLREAWGLHDNLVIGSVGRLEPLKAHQTLVRAMPVVLERYPNAILLIAGHDPWGYGRTLDSLIEHLGLQSRVRLVGFQADIPSFLHTLDVFAFASQTEGFGQVVIEAMAARRAVVVSRIAPLDEIVEHGETGLLASPHPDAFGHALLDLLSDPEKRARMGERGAQRVGAMFSAQRMAEETMSIYDSLISGRRL